MNDGKKMLSDDQLILMLDGLDELDPARQEKCVQRINRVLDEENSPSCWVICGRSSVYTRYQTKLKLNGALCLQNLTDGQIQCYLSTLQCEELWNSIKDDDKLKELLNTPLMLNIAILTYKDTLDSARWKSLSSNKDRREYLLYVYIIRQFTRKLDEKSPYRVKKAPDTEQSCLWLVWLACQLQTKSQNDFLIEQIQISWLRSGTTKKNYLRKAMLVGGLILGLSGGLLSILFFLLTLLIVMPFMLTIIENSSESAGISRDLLYNPSFLLLFYFYACFGYLKSEGIFHALVYGLVSGLIGACMNWLSHETKIVEFFKWSWEKAKERLVGEWFIDLAPYVLFWGLIGIVFGALNRSLLGGLISGLIGGALIGLMLRLIDALSKGIVGSDSPQKIFPNQGIWKSAKNSIVSAVFVLVTLTIVQSAIYIPQILLQSFMLGKYDLDKLADLYVVGFPDEFVIGFALLAGLTNGGGACIQHLSIRLTFYRSKCIPWNYARFLNYCTERRLLQRVGGHYQFIHISLRDRFADTTLEEVKSIADKVNTSNKRTLET